MPLTTDPNDPRLKHGGPDTEPVSQQEAYLVLSEEERAKGFVRPLRLSYRHVGPQINPLEDLTDEEKALHPGYIKKEPRYSGGRLLGWRFWTQAQLDAISKGCQTTTTMAQAIAETYARSPGFYGSTYCVHCQKHLPVNEFVWSDDETRVGS